MKNVCKKVGALTAAILFGLGIMGSVASAVDLNVQRVSEGGTSGAPVEANGGSVAGSLSSDGRYAVFGSYASNLVSGDTNGSDDIFLMDRDTHTITRVSEGGTSGAPVEANDYSYNPVVSADGRYVAFASSASNLVSGDTNGSDDIFLMDRDTHTITRVSEGGTSGAPVEANGYSTGASMSADGRYISFVSFASNLVSGDTNGAFDVFLMDRDTHTITRVSEGGTSGAPVQANNGSNQARIASNGRYITFVSSATNLVSGDTSGQDDIFVMDRDTHTITRVSEGGTSGSPVEGNFGSFGPSISADGRYVGFISNASNLVSGDTNGRRDAFLMDRDTHTITRVSEGGTNGSPVQADSSTYSISVSANGRYLAIESDASNLVGDDTNSTTDIFVMDRDTHTITRVSLGGTSDAPIEGNDESYEPSISANGAYVVFTSTADNLTTGDTNGQDDMFVTPGAYIPEDDADGVDAGIESAAPNSGDANNDGTDDSQQANVTSILSPTSNKYVALESTCTSNYNVQIGGESAGTPDANYSYPAGLLGFTLTGCTVGGTETVTQYFYGSYDVSKLSLRKWQDGAYKTVPGAVLTAVTIGGQPAVRVVYQITDGSTMDDDGVADGNISDPAGIAVLGASVNAPNTGIKPQTPYQALTFIVSAVAILVTYGLYVRKQKA